MIRYGIVREEYNLDGIRRVSYGVAVYGEDIATVVASVHDISTQRETVERFVELCDRLSLSPIHLSDVIEDLLGE